MELFGNTVLITGGGSGIGLALAEAFAELGNKVIICGRDQAKLSNAQHKVPGLTVKRCDLAVPKERQDLMDWTLQTLPDLNIVINNASVAHSLDLRSGPFDFDLVARELATDLRAPIEIALRLLPHLRQKKSAALVNVTTGQVYSPNAATPIYSAAKVGLHAWTQAVRYQLRDSGLKVFEVMPPIVDTEMIRDLGVPASEAISPDEVADAVLRSMAEDKEEIRIGPTRTLYVVSRIAPESVYRSLNRRIESMQSQARKGVRRAA